MFILPILQIIANSIGTLFDAKSDVGGGFTADGVKAAGSRGDKVWTLEIFVPYRVFELKKAPAMRTIWYGNFIRNRTTEGKLDIQRWSTLFRRSNHDFSAFGKLKFVE